MTNDSQISEREREILRLVAMGATNQQIANQLNISINTVKVHLRNIFGKIGAASRTEATVYAIRQGLVSVDGRMGVGEAPPGIPMSLSEPPSVFPAPDPVPDTLAPPPTLRESQTMATPPTVAELTEHPTASSGATVTPTVPLRRRAFLFSFAAVGLILVLALGYVLRQQGQPSLLEATTIPADPQINRWKSRTPLTQPRSDFGVVAYDGKLYIIGGSDAAGPSAAVLRYDPTNDIWVPLNDKPTAVSHVQAVTIRGRIYVPGGEGKDGVLRTFESYDPRDQHWEVLPSLSEPRSRYTLASVEGRLYLFGGWDGSHYRADVFIYDPASQQWSKGAALPTPRRNAGVAVVEGRIYVIGGENESGPLRVNERYDPTGNGGGRWDSAAPLPAAIATPAVASIVNRVLVFDPQQHSAAQYSPTTDSWTPVGIPDTAAISSRAVALNTSIFVFGSPSSNAPAAVSEYQALYTLFLPGTSVGP